MTEIKTNQEDFTSNCNEECFLDVVQNTVKEFNIDIPEGCEFIVPYMAIDLEEEFNKILHHSNYACQFQEEYKLINKNDIKVEILSSTEIRLYFFYNRIDITIDGFNIRIKRDKVAWFDYYDKTTVSMYLLPNTIYEICLYILECLLLNPFVTKVEPTGLSIVRSENPVCNYTEGSKYNWIYSYKLNSNDNRPCLLRLNAPDSFVYGVNDLDINNIFFVKTSSKGEHYDIKGKEIQYTINKGIKPNTNNEVTMFLSEKTGLAANDIFETSYNFVLDYKGDIISKVLFHKSTKELHNFAPDYSIAEGLDTEYKQYNTDLLKTY